MFLVPQRHVSTSNYGNCKANVTWRTHVMGGLVSLACLPTIPSSVSLGLACLFVTLGSLLPDLDARQSKLSNLEIVGITVFKPVAQLLHRRLSHRGPFHSLFGLLIVSVLCSLPLALFLDAFAGVGLSLGFASHLVLDACTRSGVPLWWPTTTRVHFLPRSWRITTSSLAEDSLFLLLALFAVFALLRYLQEPGFQGSSQLLN